MACTDDLIPLPEDKKSLTILDLAANIYCALIDIAKAIREGITLRHCSKIKEATIVGDQVVIGVPFIPIGHKDGNKYAIGINDDTWTITLDSAISGSDSEIFLYYEL